MTASIIVLTKDPVPGRVKTRLIPALGDAGAARLHEAMAHETVRRALDSGLPVTVSIDGDMNGTFARSLGASGCTVEPQASGDLGQRLRHALRGPGRRIALGTDCVVFDPAWLRTAATCDEPVVIGPSDDGGYWIIGIDTSHATVLDVVFSNMPWSTRGLLDHTLRHLTNAGIERAMLPLSYDVDEPEDLDRLRGDPRCPPSLSTLLSTSPR